MANRFENFKNVSKELCETLIECSNVTCCDLQDVQNGLSMIVKENFFFAAV